MSLYRYRSIGHPSNTCLYSLLNMPVALQLSPQFDILCLILRQMFHATYSFHRPPQPYFKWIQPFNVTTQQCPCFHTIQCQTTHFLYIQISEFSSLSSFRNPFPAINFHSRGMPIIIMQQDLVAAYFWVYVLICELFYFSKTCDLGSLYEQIRRLH